MRAARGSHLMRFSLVLIVSSASAELSTEQLLELQWIREHVNQRCRRVEGPARLTPYGYRPIPRGPYDQAIEDALLQKANEELTE